MPAGHSPSTVCQPDKTKQSNKKNPSLFHKPILAFINSLSSLSFSQVSQKQMLFFLFVFTKTCKWTYLTIFYIPVLFFIIFKIFLLWSSVVLLWLKLERHFTATRLKRNPNAHPLLPQLTANYWICMVSVAMMGSWKYEQTAESPEFALGPVGVMGTPRQ